MILPSGKMNFMIINRKQWLFSYLALATLLLIFANPTRAQDQGIKYTFGVIPQFEAQKLRSIWQPIINYLKEELGYDLVIKGSPTIPDFENELFQGAFDFAYTNPYQITLINRSIGYYPIIKDVGRTLHGILVVKIDSGITEVSQLNGKTVAFPSPNALGASLLLRQELHDIFQLNFFPRYVKTHDSVYLNVLLNEVSAGGGVQKTLDRQATSFRAALKVIHKTKDVASHPITAHPRVPDEVVNAIKAALLKLGASTEGMKLLSKIPMKQVGLAKMSDYLPLQAMGLERFYAR